MGIMYESQQKLSPEKYFNIRYFFFETASSRGDPMSPSKKAVSKLDAQTVKAIRLMEWAIAILSVVLGTAFTIQLIVNSMGVDVPTVLNVVGVIGGAAGVTLVAQARVVRQNGSDTADNVEDDDDLDS